MIERDGEGAFPYTLHGGTAPMTAQWYFREQLRLPVAVQRWTFPPGGTEGVHAHPPTPTEHAETDARALDELYVLLRGRATMSLGEETVELAPGDALLAPAGVEHGVVNEGPEDAEFLVVWGPPGEGLDWTRSGMGRAAADAQPRSGP